jgi:zinc transporter 2
MIYLKNCRVSVKQQSLTHSLNKSSKLPGEQYSLWFVNICCIKFLLKQHFILSEILGALLSILLLWVLTGIVVYMAIKRIISNDYEINATVMLIVAACGVAFNLL